MAAVEQGFFVDSGFYPERNGDGIARQINGGVGVNTVVQRDADYLAPVCHHFGDNHIPAGADKPCDLIGGCTLCYPEKIIYIDELDPEDNVQQRLEPFAEHRHDGLLRPEVEWYGDGWVNLQLFLPTSSRVAEFAALQIAQRMGMGSPEVIHKLAMHPSEGTYLEVKGKINFDIDPRQLKIPERPTLLSADDIRAAMQGRKMKVVAATVGQDEHSVGMREIIDIKHGGLEGFGFECHYLGTSVSLDKLVNAAIELDPEAILISTIITHADIHRLNMKRLHELCVEKGIRERVILVGGGTQVTHEIAVEAGLDGGFGRGTKGIDVASFLIKARCNHNRRP
jgi:D-ornithine 4,5-aminomutase subunit beta